ncbi:MAG: SDR family NAD(P)-dependent oxidoreductase [Dehalococcoidia bacterium]
MGRLDGRVAIVTGSARGIGRGVAIKLAEEGASVVVADFGGALDGTGGDKGPADEVVNEITRAGGRALASYGDVSKFADMQATVADALRAFGRLDILCHVAGILRDRMVFNMTEEEWDAVLSVHLKGAFNSVRNAVPPMLAQGYGRILLFSSGSGLGSPGQANYSAAKEGMVGFSRALARELGPHGIAVNAVYPGGQTRMSASVPTNRDALRTRSGMAPATTSRTVPYMMEENKLAGSPRDPDNNAPPVAWLVSRPAA